MNYKGYIGKVEYDEKSETFFGKVINIKDIITFQGKSVSELKRAFKDSIEDYLDFCKERNEEPDNPFLESGVVYIPQKLQKKIYRKALESNLNIDTWVTKVLEKAL
jgi:predicted HicB family RNase H-like nuclease